MTEATSLNSSTRRVPLPLEVALLELIVAKSSEDTRISHILAKLEVRYTSISQSDYEQCIEPLACLDPASLCKLINHCNQKASALTNESGLSLFKQAFHELLIRLIRDAMDQASMRPKPNQLYDSLQFGSLVATRQEISLNPEAIATLEKTYAALPEDAKSKETHDAILPAHVHRTIKASYAYLIACMAATSSNASFLTVIGLDVIKYSYTTVKLTRNHPQLLNATAALGTSGLPVHLKTVSRILEEALLRYLRGHKLGDGALLELTEAVTGFFEIQESKVAISKLNADLNESRRVIDSAQQEKEKLQEKLRIEREECSKMIEGLQANQLANQRSAAVQTVELSQKVRARIAAYREKALSEIKKFELVLSQSLNPRSAEMRLLNLMQEHLEVLDKSIEEVIQ